jgi:hypothetical protein
VAFHHESAYQYLDLTPALMLGLVGFIAARYVSRGVGAVEVFVLSGVASALFIGLNFFLRRMGSPR